jgi:hypothetical protein
MSTMSSRRYSRCLANSTRSRKRPKTAPFWGVPDTLIPRLLVNSRRPSSRRVCSARKTVILFTPSTPAMSFASGRRSPGRASPVGDGPADLCFYLFMKQGRLGTINIDG